ncbi:MAG TPA: D-alanine--D-alanine ligase [Bacteroidales bacterium]|nr:D-alanine--D-alanine ligase [Bacteroidales bacterium]HPS74467.1 D-alanine--D-alanine ligase [Bacteroidales bacterium]
MLNIAIVAGGDSGEYEISIGSGRQVEKNIDHTRFTPYLIEIKGDHWTYLGESVRIPVDRNDFSIHPGGKKITFDAVFNAIHGTPGENGLLQGYFDLMKIPYTSCDLMTSALTFNKAYCKAVVASYDVPVASSVHLFRRDIDPVKKVLDGIKLPCFVKPNNGGSSVGMSKVKRPEDLAAAIEKAFAEDDQVLAEEFIPGRELTCGVIRTQGNVIALPVTEIISSKDFFDYEAKYTNGLAKEVVPAEISEEMSLHCRNISSMLFERLNCKGVVRFDYILSGDTFWFLEVNTVPGLSEASIVPKMANAYGWSFTELITRLLEETITKS